MQGAPADGGASSGGAQADESAGGGAGSGGPGGYAGACDAPKCAPAERTAIDGLVEMAQGPVAGGPSGPTVQGLVHDR